MIVSSSGVPHTQAYVQQAVPARSIPTGCRYQPPKPQDPPPHRSTPGSSLTPGTTWLPNTACATACCITRVLNSCAGCSRSSSDSVPDSSATAASLSFVARATEVMSQEWVLYRNMYWKPGACREGPRCGGQCLLEAAALVWQGSRGRSGETRSAAEAGLPCQKQAALRRGKSDIPQPLHSLLRHPRGALPQQAAHLRPHVLVRYERLVNVHAVHALGGVAELVDAHIAAGVAHNHNAGEGVHLRMEPAGRLRCERSPGRGH